MELGVPDMLETLCSSGCRMTIIDELLDRPVSTAGLEQALTYDGSTVRRNIKTLVDEGWVVRRDGVNRVKKERRFLLDMAVETTSTFFTYGKYREFWDGHVIEGIPDEFLRRIHRLRDGEIVESTPTEIFQPHRRFMENVLRSGWLRGIAPVYHPDYAPAVVDLAESMESIEIIVTEEVHDRFLEDGGEPLQKVLEQDDVALVCSERDCDVALTVTDEFLSLGLFNRDGTYDTHRDLMCHSEPAIEWGLDLYRHVRETL